METIIQRRIKKPVEYRLYYGEAGEVVTYTCEDLPGTYIVITKEQFAEARWDATVVDGRLTYKDRITHVIKLAKNGVEGVKTSKYDINIITDVDYNYWSKEENGV